MPWVNGVWVNPPLPEGFVDDPGLTPPGWPNPPSGDLAQPQAYPDSYYQDMVADDYHAPWFNREEYHRLNGPEVPRYSDGSLSPNANLQRNPDDIDFEEVEFDHPSWEADRVSRGRTVDQFQEQQRQYGRERAFRQHANDYPSPGSDLNNPSDYGIERARADLTQRGWSVEEVNDITDRTFPGWREGMDQTKYQGDREFARQRQQQRELDANQQWIQKTDPTAVMIDEGPFMNGLNDILLGLPAGASGVGGAMGGMAPLLIGLGLLAASQKPAVGQTQGSKNPRERSISGPKYQEHRKKEAPGQEPLTLAKKSSQKVQTQKAKSEAKKTGSRESAEIDKRVKQAEQSRYRERDPMQYGPKTQKAIKEKQKGKQTSMNQQPPWINAIMNIAAGNFEQGLQELANSYNQQKGDQVNA